jgi:hypothetical protein
MLPTDFQATVTELVLILLDIRQKELRIWLNGQFKQQAMDANHYLFVCNKSFVVKVID